MKKVFSIFYVSVILLIVTVITSCSNKIESKEFLKWLSEEKNGLVKTKKSNGFEVKMEYLPSAYFVSFTSVCETQNETYSNN